MVFVRQTTVTEDITITMKEATIDTKFAIILS